MAYSFKKPALVPTLAVICVTMLMGSLGIWQLKRLEWKNALLADIESAQVAPPKPLTSYAAAELPKAEWHNVVVTGHLLSDKELHATPRYLKEQMGYGILSPLAFSTPQGTEYVMVNRGWVPPEQKEPGTRTATSPKTTVTVEGVLRNPLPQGMFRPNNRADMNLWFWYDIPAMGQATHLKLLPVMIDATRITVGDKPAADGITPFPLEITIRNDHLGYAITWFMIGLSAIVMFVCGHLQRKP